MKQLEKKLSSVETTVSSDDKLRKALVVDFMSLIRRHPVSKLKTFQDLFTFATYSILNSPFTEEIDIVYDSYVEDSIKECERIRRSIDIEPLEFVNLRSTTAIPVQMDRFWACGSNKEALQRLSREFFTECSKKSSCLLVLSGYVSDNEGVTPCIELHQGYPQRCTELDSNIEEADSRIIPHIEKAIMRGVQKVISSQMTQMYLF